MKQLFSLIACHCILLVGIQAQELLPDFSAGVAELRALLHIADNVALVQIAVSSGAKPVHSTNETVTSSNIVIRFELRSNSVPVYDAGVTAEFYRNGTYATLWSSSGAEIIVRDSGVPRISYRRAVYILARRFNLCPQIKYFQNEDISLLYLMDPSTKVGRLIYRASVVYFGRVTSLGSETTEIVQPTALIDAITGEVIQFWNGLTAMSATTKKILAYGGNENPAVKKITYEALEVGLEADGQCVYSTPDIQRCETCHESASQLRSIRYLGNGSLDLRAISEAAQTDSFIIRTGFGIILTKVQNLANRKDGPFSPTRFACDAPQNEKYDYVNGAYSPLNDAMNNGQTTVNMYRAYVSSIDRPHFDYPLKMRVHYSVDYSEAFLAGKYFYFGDSSNARKYPQVTLDIVGHELGHGFTGSSSGSKLENLFEAGGINEAFSDMSGQAALFYSGREATMKPGIQSSRTGAPVRDMCNPRWDKVSIDQYSNYTNDINTHYSSGLYNKVFCSLSRLGGVWNVANAFQVFAYANRMSWSQKTTFHKGVCGVEKATNKLLGANAVKDVSNAFKQVGLWCTES